MNIHDLNPFVPKPVKWAKSYRSYRVQNRCVPRVWNNGISACALGAFLGARNVGEAHQTGCVSEYMPKWLVRATPGIFDFHGYSSPGYRLVWADALYMPGGLIERASKLSEEERAVMWEDARARLNELIMRSRGCTNVPSDEAKKVCQTSNYYEWVFATYIRSKGGQEGKSEAAERAAGSVVTAIDDALTAAGA